MMPAKPARSWQCDDRSELELLDLVPVAHKPGMFEVWHKIQAFLGPIGTREAVEAAMFMAQLEELSMMDDNSIERLAARMLVERARRLVGVP